MGKGNSYKKRNGAKAAKVLTNKKHNSISGAGNADLNSSAVQKSAQQGMAAISDNALNHSGKQTATDSIEDVEDLETGSQSQTLGEKDSDSESISRSLGDEDSDSADNSAVPETAPSMDAEMSKQKPSFASLFTGNREASNGIKLQQINLEEGPVQIFSTDLKKEQDGWKFCLAGYFAGRFPGKTALQQLMVSWKVKVASHFHNSGWIIFKFKNEDDQMKVIQGGPYMVFGRPLLLKIMPKFFRFDNEELSKFPVWVQLKNLPLELWTSLVLSKICSRLGKPVYTDQLTSSMVRISYARALVEVDLSKEIVKHIDLVLPNGDHMVQEVYYENLPQFCSHCKRAGHSLGVCRNLEGRAATKTAKGGREDGAGSDEGPAANQQGVGNESPTAIQQAMENEPAAAKQQGTNQHPVGIEPAATQQGIVVEQQGHLPPEVTKKNLPIANRGMAADGIAIPQGAKGNIEPLVQSAAASEGSKQPLVTRETAENAEASFQVHVGKNRNKYKHKKKDRGNSFAEFFADMGGNSPTPQSK